MIEIVNKLRTFKTFLLLKRKELIDLRNVIVPTNLKTKATFIDNDGILGQLETIFNCDNIYLNGFNDLQRLQLHDYELVTTPSDYAKANGGTGKYFQRSAPYFIMGNEEDYNSIILPLTQIDCIDADGYRCRTAYSSLKMGVVPATRFDIPTILNERKSFPDFGKIASYRNPRFNEEFVHTIEAGFYPQGRAENAEELEKLFQTGKIKPTGKKYTGYLQCNGEFAKNIEYAYQGNFYVRVLSNNFGYDYKIRYNHRNEPIEQLVRVPDKNTVYDWFKVEPLVWVIRNWNDLPTLINPNGSGKANFLEVTAQQAIMGGIPFHTGITMMDNETQFLEYELNNLYLLARQNRAKISYWQNSSLRGFLNGINVNNVKENGNSKYNAANGGDFSNHGFLQEAFIVTPELVKSYLKPLQQSADEEKSQF